MLASQLAQEQEDVEMRNEAAVAKEMEESIRRKKQKESILDDLVSTILVMYITFICLTTIPSSHWELHCLLQLLKSFQHTRVGVLTREKTAGQKI